MTTVLIGISVGLGALVVLLLVLLVIRWRSGNTTDERVAEVVASLNARMDELGLELAGALERAGEGGGASRILGEVAGSIDLDEVLSRTLEAAGALEHADAALVMLPDPNGGKPLVATLGLSVEEAERHAITGPPDGRLARSITMSYTYPELERESSSGDGVINAGLAVPLPGDNSTLGYLTVCTRRTRHECADDDVRQLETLALRAGPAIENARRFREARQLADLDALTGLHNRRYFHETLARECSRAHRYERKLSLIVFDLDDFKEINDRIGHLAGDTVLAEAAERVRDVVRSADIACRVGGDEFAVILPESSTGDADQLYHRLRGPVSSRGVRQAGRARSPPGPPARPAGSRSRGVSPTCRQTTTRRPSSSAPTRRSTARRSSARDRSSKRASAGGRRRPTLLSSQERQVVSERDESQLRLGVPAAHGLLDQRALPPAQPAVVAVRSGELLQGVRHGRPRQIERNRPEGDRVVDRPHLVDAAHRPHLPPLALVHREELWRRVRFQRKAAAPVAEPRSGGLRLDQADAALAVARVVLGDVAGRRGADVQAGLDDHPAQLGGDHAARRSLRRVRARERRAVAAEAAPEASRHDRALGVCDLLRLQRRLGARDRAGKDGAEGHVGVAGHRREALDRALGEGPAIERAAHAARKCQLALRERGVEVRAARGRTVAQLPVSGPQVDARGGRLVGIRLALAPDAPSPRPDRAKPALRRDLLGGKRLQLGHLEPGAAGGALAAARAGRRVEAQHQAELRRRDPDGRELGDALAEQRAQRAAGDDRPLLRH